MIDPFLRFKILRVGRIFRDGGWRLLLLAPFILFGVAQAFLQLTRLHPAFFQSLLGILLLSIHFGRKDAFFLRLLGPRSRLLLTIENLFWVLPLEVFFWIRCAEPADRLWAIPVLLVAGCLYFLPAGNRFKMQARFRSIRRLTGLLPVDLYEWKAVLRRYFGLFLVLYGTSLAALIRVPVSGVALLVLALLFSGNLEWDAPPEVQLGGGSRKALLKKVRQNVVFFTLVALPLVIVQLLLYPHLEETAFLLFCLVVAQVLCLYWLLLPLSRFPQPLSAGQRVLEPIVFCIAAPLLPLSIYLLYQKYRKAKWALQPYWS